MPMAGLDFSVELTGADKVSAALLRAKPILKENTVPVMEAAAQTIASGAASRASRHPSGLWRTGRSGRLASPKYRVRKRGEYLFGVETPGGAAGRAEAMSEFARLAVTPQGAALVRQLDALYGRPGGSGGGRILWAAADELADSIVSDIEAATAEAAAEIEREMGEA